MRKLILLATLALSACSNGNVLGQSEGECDKNPAACSSVRQAHKNSDGPVTPPPSEAALQRADTMRVWVAPMRTSSGVLTNSGHVYLD